MFAAPVGQFGEPTNGVPINFDIGYCFPFFAFSIKFQVLDTLQVEELFGLDAPFAVRQGVNKSGHESDNNFNKNLSVRHSFVRFVG